MNLEKIINQEGTTFVDVREPFEMVLGKIENAINIPLRRVANRIVDFEQMSKPIVLYCRSGNRSNQAMQYLRSHGINEVYDGINLKTIRTLMKQEVVK